ncbi:cysteine-rich CWC family protein [Bacillus cecembensis]|uniref:cysteine-rich CWC family protein n=1 Tax=Solibacillus cecembensis TaxID=459347 RepID=UPI000716F791
MIVEVRQAKLCPLCQKDNHCGMTDNPSTETCWCFHVGFPKAIFDQLPSDREKACICENCLVEFKD